jgi:hypothetical protein
MIDVADAATTKLHHQADQRRLASHVRGGPGSARAKGGALGLLDRMLAAARTLGMAAAAGGIQALQAAQADGPMPAGARLSRRPGTCSAGRASAGPSSSKVPWCA